MHLYVCQIHGRLIYFNCTIDQDLKFDLDNAIKMDAYGGSALVGDLEEDTCPLPLSPFETGRGAANTFWASEL